MPEIKHPQKTPKLDDYIQWTKRQILRPEVRARMAVQGYVSLPHFEYAKSRSLITPTDLFP